LVYATNLMIGSKPTNGEWEMRFSGKGPWGTMTKYLQRGAAPESLDKRRSGWCEELVGSERAAMTTSPLERRPSGLRDTILRVRDTSYLAGLFRTQPTTTDRVVGGVMLPRGFPPRGLAQESAILVSRSHKSLYKASRLMPCVRIRLF